MAICRVTEARQAATASFGSDPARSGSAALMRIDRL